MSSKFGPSGGVGGSAYDAPTPTSNGPWRISEAQGRSGSRIDQIELIWSNSVGSTKSSPTFGGGGGDPFEFTIENGDYLTEIRGSVGSNNNSVVLFSLQFFTKSGKVSPVFGSSTPASFYFQSPPGYQITGIFGRSGSAVDALGVYIDLIPS
ncbi:MAG TPA: jacalin-like lectin [Blastocatellia bacterium]|nr:jacalin-like lectin [Blastocatellia bacterium]